MGGPSVNQQQVGQLGVQQQIIITTRGTAVSSATLPQASPSTGQPIVVQLPDQAGDTLSNMVALNPTQRSAGEQVTLTIAHAAQTVNSNVPGSTQKHPSQTQVLSAVSTNMPSTSAQSSMVQTANGESTADQSSAAKFSSIEELCDNLQRLAHSKSMYAGSIPGGKTWDVSLNTGQKQADSAQSVVATPTDAATPSMYVQLSARNMSEPDCQITGTTESDCQITGTTEADCQITGTTDPNCEITRTTGPNVQTTGSTTECGSVVELDTSVAERLDSNNPQATSSNSEMEYSASQTQLSITGAITDKHHEATTTSTQADDDMQFPSTIEVTLTSKSPETGEKQTAIIVDGQTLATREEVNDSEKTATVCEEGDNSDGESGRLVIADTYSESVVTESDTGAAKQQHIVTDNEQGSSSIKESLVPDNVQGASKEQHVVNSSITTLGKLVLSDSVAESLLPDNVEQTSVSAKDQPLRNSHRSESMSESIVTESDQGYVSAKDQSFDHPLIAPSSPGPNPADISTEDGVLSAMDVTHDESMEGLEESSNKNTVDEKQSDNIGEASASVEGRIRDPSGTTIPESQLDSLNKADNATHEQSDPSNTVHSCPTAQSDYIDTPDTHTKEPVSGATSEHNDVGEESSISSTASPDTRSRDVILKTLLDDSIDRAFQSAEDITADTQDDNIGDTQQG